MLEVTVQHHAARPPGLGQSGEDGGLFAEVPGEADAAHPGILFGGLLDGQPGVVPGAVVDKEQLIGDVRLGQQAADGPGGQGDGLLLIIGGKHHGQQSGAGGHSFHWISSCFRMPAHSRSWGCTPSGF